jgi:hypothetical protein
MTVGSQNTLGWIRGACDMDRWRIFEQVNELTDSIKRRGFLDQLSVLLVLDSREGLCFMESVTHVSAAHRHV